MRCPYFTIFILLSCFVLDVQAARQALVIGNDSYTAIAALSNARADARAVARALESSGFKVTLALDQGRGGMNAALRKFKNGLAGGDEAVFFYAGHGVQLGGANYLLPVDIKGDDEDQIKDDAVALQRILDDFAEQKTRFSLAIVDACRDNPFRGKGRSFATRGLVPTAVAGGQMVIFSAGAGQQALDRLGDRDTSPNGLFTRVLLKEIEQGERSIDGALKAVRAEVVRLARTVGHEQSPALYDQSVGEFHFRRPTAPVAAVAAPVAGAENEFWKAVKAGNTIDDYETYLAQYPNGKYVEEARTSVASLQEGARAAAVKKETDAWEAAAKRASVESYRAYLRAYPQGIYAALAQARLKRLGDTPDVAADAGGKGAAVRDCPACPELVSIPGGSFEMGSYDGEPDEKPVRRVTVPAFLLGKTEVTQAQWRATMGSNPADKKFQGCNDCPVTGVSWDDAQRYLAKLNATTGRQYRLPSEAEWEYACKAGGTQAHCGSSELDSVGWNARNAGQKPHPAGQKPANAFGLHDMSGNAWEWVQDCWNAGYAGAPADATPWLRGDCGRRVRRGGSWESAPAVSRASFRFGGMAGRAGSDFGFRVAQSIPKAN